MLPRAQMEGGSRVRAHRCGRLAIYRFVAIAQNRVLNPDAVALFDIPSRITQKHLFS